VRALPLSLVLLSAHAVAAAPTRVLFLGDSLTAGKGVSRAQAFPALVGELLADAGMSIAVLNSGVSGDTTAGGRRRVKWALKGKPDLVFLALGANDGLRGVKPAVTEANLDAILEAFAAAGVPAVIAGMHMPTNMGEEYRQAYSAIFPRVAERHGIPLLPFLLEGVALQPELNQADRIHPNPAGHRRIAETVAGFLAPHLP
jgi:acyl-CoA thioesterase-1